MKLFKWLFSKLRDIRRRRTELKLEELFTKLIHYRLGLEEIRVEDYLHYEHYPFDDDYFFKQPNEQCHFIMLITESQELIFLKRDYMGAWYKLTYHSDQLLKVMSLKIRLIELSRKIKKLSQS